MGCTQLMVLLSLNSSNLVCIAVSSLKMRAWCPLAQIYPTGGAARYDLIPEGGKGRNAFFCLRRHRRRPPDTFVLPPQTGVESSV